MKMQLSAFLCAVAVMLSFYVKSQTKVNLILSVDDKIAEGAFMNVILRTFIRDSSKDYNITYLPGSLFLPDKFEIENQLQLSDSIHLLFDYSIICKQEQRMSSYQIDFKKSWVSSSYTVVKIFNIDTGKNRKKYLPLPSKTYTYDVYYPGGSAIAVRRQTSRHRCD